MSKPRSEYPVNPGSISGGAIVAISGLCLSILVIANDISAMNVALPSIERDFDTDISTVQWVINAYALFTAMLIVPAGKLADIYGRRKIFLIGTAVFASMSLVGGLAVNVYWLIAARALMGIGGALMWPSVLGIVFGLLPKEKSGLAGGLIIGAAGLGQALGPIVGGALTEYLSWRWIQYINVPISLLAIAIVLVQVKESAGKARGIKIDYTGIAFLSLSLLSLLFALDQANLWGWSDWRILLCLAISAALMILFIIVERSANENALIPPEIFNNKRFVASAAAIALIMPTFFSSLLYLPQMMQKVLNFSVLASGLGLLPMMALYTSFSFIQSRLTERFGDKAVIASGALILFAGILLLSRLETGFNYISLVPGMSLIGVGLGLFLSANMAAAVSSIDPSKTSLAGGLMLMFQIAGGALGLGLTTARYVASSQARLDSDITEHGINLSAGELQKAEGILSGIVSPGELVNSLGQKGVAIITHAVPDAFLTGITEGFMLDALLALLGFLVALFFVGGRLRKRA